MAEIKKNASRRTQLPTGMETSPSRYSPQDTAELIAASLRAPARLRFSTHLRLFQRSQKENSFIRGTPRPAIHPF